MTPVKNQWIFVDESGKPEVYSTRGANLVETNQTSRFLILAAVRCENHLDLQQLVTEFRLSLLKDKDLSNIFSSAYTLDTFHAQVDYPQIKERFYKFILELPIFELASTTGFASG